MFSWVSPVTFFNLTTKKSTKSPVLHSLSVCGRFRGVQYLGQDFIMYDGVGGEQHQNRLQQFELLQSVLHQLPQHVNDVPRRRLQTHSLTHLNEPLIRQSHRCHYSETVALNKCVSVCVFWPRTRLHVTWVSEWRRDTAGWFWVLWFRSPWGTAGPLQNCSPSALMTQETGNQHNSHMGHW